MIRQAKQNFHSEEFEGCNSKQLFQKVNKLCTPKVTKALPSDDSDYSLAQRFSEFFANKIRNIKNILRDSSNDYVSVPITDFMF